MAAIMRKTVSFALVLLLVFGAEMARGWVDDMKNHFNEFSEEHKLDEKVDGMKNDLKEFSEEHKLDEKAESVKQGASEAYDHAKDKAETWSAWAKDKMGFGNNEEVKETGHYVVDEAGDAAIKTTRKVNTGASGR